MNLKRFLENYVVTEDRGHSDVPAGLSMDVDFRYVLSELGGKSFNSGLYRVYREDQIAPISRSLESAFNKRPGAIAVFGYDWLGRQFAICKKENSPQERNVSMFEIGAGEVMAIPCSIIDFHNIELVDYAGDALAIKFYNEWKRINKSPIPHDACVGYKTPLFLGGSDTIQNLELTNLDVYLESCLQLKKATRGSA